MSRFRSLLLATILTLTATPLLAETSPPAPEVLAAAKAVIEASGGRTEALKAMTSIKSTYLGQLKGQDAAMITKAQAALDKLMDEKSAPIQAFLDEMEASAIDFYATRFTADELKIIATFQGSPTGTKFRAVVPDLMSLMQPPMMRFQTGLQQALQNEMQKP